MLLARRTLYLVSLIALAACSDASGPRAPSATVTVVGSPLVATTGVTGASTWIQFTVPLRIENTGTVTVAYKYCISRVDAHTASTWTAAWTTVCQPGTGFGPLEVPPGESRDVTETVSGIISGPGAPTWYAAPGASEYRFVPVLLSPDGKSLTPEVVSNSFTVTIGN